ncbi:IS66 family transposase, partial [Candidatus Woesearchaeota archaeon]|nr:IS66 family transposase [Candidatus Woesearchaeota archaeon]
WFTCLLHPEIDMTSNKAERALREPVVQRKISSLWNEKGIRIKETIMSVLSTWNLRGLNTYSMLRQTLSS